MKRTETGTQTPRTNHPENRRPNRQQGGTRMSYAIYVPYHLAPKDTCGVAMIKDGMPMLMVKAR